MKIKIILILNCFLLFFFNLSGLIKDFSISSFSDKREIYYSKDKVIYSTKINNQDYVLIKFSQKNNYFIESSKLKQIKHPNIIKVKACNDTELLILEKKGTCSLYNFIKNPELYVEKINNLDLNSIKYNIIKNIISALNYLHTEKKYVHLDLKAENIILFIKQDLKSNIISIKTKIIDFESCHEIKDTNPELSKFMGTFEYAPPEIIDLVYIYQKYTIGFFTDIYDLGLLIFFIIYEKAPSEIIFSRENIEFNDLNKEWSKNIFLIEKIKYNRWLDPFLDSQENTENKNINLLIKACCAKRPEDRPTIQNIKV